LTEDGQTDHFSQGSIVESTHWMVLHRPVELAALIVQVNGLGCDPNSNVFGE